MVLRYVPRKKRGNMNFCWIQIVFCEGLLCAAMSCFFLKKKNIYATCGLREWNERDEKL